MWWFAIVKEPCDGIAMNCGRIVVSADTEEAARSKINERASKLPGGQYVGLVTHGPYNSEEQANSARKAY